jgi:hypothetical protein
MGCHNFCNYKHLLKVSCDGEWVDGGKFLPLMGSFAIIPKAKRGLLLNWTSYCYLDAVHMDIAFGNCLSVGGFQYALILVVRVTRYNWTFCLKSLSSEHIFGALHLFCVALKVLLPVLLPDASTLIVNLSCLVLLFCNVSLTMVLKLLRLPLSVNLPTAWWSLIGRLWYGQGISH